MVFTEAAEDPPAESLDGVAVTEAAEERRLGSTCVSPHCTGLLHCCDCFLSDADWGGAWTHTHMHKHTATPAGAGVRSRGRSRRLRRQRGVAEAASGGPGWGFPDPCAHQAALQVGRAAGPTPLQQAVAERLIREAYNAGSADNLAVVVIDLQQPGAPWLQHQGPGTNPDPDPCTQDPQGAPHAGNPWMPPDAAATAVLDLNSSTMQDPDSCGPARSWGPAVTPARDPNPLILDPAAPSGLVWPGPLQRRVCSLVLLPLDEHGVVPGGSEHGVVPGGSEHGVVPGGSEHGVVPGGSEHGVVPGGSEPLDAPGGGGLHNRGRQLQMRSMGSDPDLDPDPDSDSALVLLQPGARLLCTPQDFEAAAAATATATLAPAGSSSQLPGVVVGKKPSSAATAPPTSLSVPAPGDYILVEQVTVLPARAHHMHMHLGSAIHHYQRGEFAG